MLNAKQYRAARVARISRRTPRTELVRIYHTLLGDKARPRPTREDMARAINKVRYRTQPPPGYVSLTQEQLKTYLCAKRRAPSFWAGSHARETFSFH